MNKITNMIDYEDILELFQGLVLHAPRATRVVVRRHAELHMVDACAAHYRAVKRPRGFARRAAR